ncbi:MAG: hypothetical protein H6722_27745 [Sandaracinus sp.]|nr:hypothetical protein [Sandaracinus sp.]MCB9618012.1 hypothetical protein [Sandaracinus sp.]MCB9622253.1 hypothetical protein [Sandaracinus sp.]
MSRSRRITVRIGAPRVRLPSDVTDVRAVLAAGYTLLEVRQWVGGTGDGVLDVPRQLALRRLFKS